MRVDAATRWVVLDTRLVRHTGIGTYIRTLFSRLPRLADGLEYLAISNPGLPRVGTFPVLTVRSRPLDLTTQLLPFELRGVNAALLHVPYITAPLLWPGRLVITIHDLIPLILPETIPSRVRRGAFHLWVRMAARKATVIVTDSECSRRDIVRLLRVPSRKVVVIPPAIGEEFIPADRNRAGDAHRLLSGERYFLSVGRHKPHKNLSRLIRAFHRVRQEQRAALVIAGPEPPPADLRDEVQRLGLEHTVQFAGHVDDADLPGYYQAAVAVVIPSLYEGFGLPALEGMACGTPVVASNRAALPEVVGDAALLIDPEDEHGLAAAMLRLLRDDSLRQELRERGLARAQTFSAQTSAARLADIYRTLAQEERPNPDGA